MIKINTTKQQFISEIQDIFVDKTVLDLACHSGESTSVVLACQPKKIYSVDIRADKVDIARKNITDDRAEFLVGDITDADLLDSLVPQSQVITCFGAFYHLFDHFRFFSRILRPHVEHVVIETLFGPESPNPEMFWGFEDTQDSKNGWLEGCSTIAHGTPNLSWILQSARVFGFECDWVVKYIARPPSLGDFTELPAKDYRAMAGADWPDYQEFIKDPARFESVCQELGQMIFSVENDRRRMALKLYNSRLIDSSPLDITNIYEWK